MPDTEPVFSWWLWPNLLALDAPLVAVVWQRFLAASFGVGVPLPASAVLGLVVWGIYLADRRLDARSGTVEQPRHRFAATFPWLVSGLAVVALIAAAALAVTLPDQYLVTGGIIAAFVAGYFALVHLLNPIGLTADGGKEMLVGLLFAAGVAVPLVAEQTDGLEWLASVIGFGLACWLNCLLIDHWEEAASRSDTRGLLIAVAALVCAGLSPRAVECAIAGCVGLLLILHFGRERLGARLARVLADVVLLTPLAVWCVP